MNNPTQHRNWNLGIRGRVAGAALALAILLGLLVAAPSAQAQTFTTFDAPGAGMGALQGTLAVSINTAGAIAGIYIVADNVAHGFVRAADGTITDFDAPGAGTGYNQGTFPISINTAGDIAGMYTDASTVYHGFVRAANGTITAFDAPGAATGVHLGTTLISINTAGDVTGGYRDASGVHHGFVRAADGTITTLDGAPISINTAGAIAGFYSDASNVDHGFVRAANGTITDFDAPGAGTTGTRKGFQGTVPISINTEGDIAGTYTDASGARHGFVRAANGRITSFDGPGAAPGTGILQGTIGGSINDAGDITGIYFDASVVAHGFVRAANGNITRFDAPGAGTGMLQGTGGSSINATGDIAGAYVDASGVFHGFELTPARAATTTTLWSTPNPSVCGQAVTFTSEVISSDGAPPDGQTVSFMEGTTVLGTETFSGGSARFTTSTLSVGTDSITAVYGGDWNLAGSTSKAVRQVVSKTSPCRWALR